MVDIYKNIQEYNPNKKQKILVVFDDMIVDMLSNKKRSLIVTELFIRGGKVDISFVFITKPYFLVSKKVRLNPTHYCVMKIPNKRQLQQFVFNHSSNIDFQEFMNLFVLQNVLQKHIIFWLLILFLHQIVLHISERIF